jgi:uncharacterized tellurite resistance protein B-like protein
MMGSLVNFLLNRSASVRDVDTAALQVRLLVSMAAVDERITDSEVEQISSFIDRVARNDRDHAKLHRHFEHLLVAPPHLDRVLDELERHEHAPALARTLVRELTEVAYADSAIDHREEFLLNLVGNVFGLETVSLYDAFDDELDIADVHRLAQLRRAG